MTICMIEESLLSLDSEYRESLAQCLVEKRYLTDTPLRLSLGTIKQQRELKDVYNQILSQKQVNEIIDFISNEMKNDFQYCLFKRIVSEYYKDEKDCEINI